MTNVQPLFADTGSHRLVAAAQSNRSPADIEKARTAALLTGPTWQLWAIPRTMDPYTIEMSIEQATNERSALNCLIDQLPHEFSALVIHTAADGARSDVTEQFARTWASDMGRQGWEPEALQRIKFLSVHFSNDELDSLCGVGGELML